MKFTIALVSALAAAAVTFVRVAAVSLEYEPSDSIVFARADDGSLFVRYADDVSLLELEARGGYFVSKVKVRKGGNRPVGSGKQ